MTLRLLVSLMLLSLLAAPSLATDASELPGIGVVAPAFALYAFTDGNGDEFEPVHLDDHCGLRPGSTKGVVVSFVDSASQSDLKVVDGWWRKHNRKGLDAIAISVEERPADFSDQVVREGYKFPVLDDRHGIVSKRYGIPSIPFTFLLNAECRVVGFIDQPLSGVSAQMEPAIEAVLEGQLAASRRFDDE